MEDFVSFEIAKKLKENGFREKCFACYSSYSGILYYNEIKYVVPSRILNVKDFGKCYNVFIDNVIDAPTISQVLDWLRVNKEVDLVIKPSFLYDDNLNRIREYNCDIFAPQLNKPYHTSYHDSYELAALVGIEYVLDNLI